MRILVTGATGFVGSHTVRGLVDAGNAVGAVIRQNSTTDLLDSRAQRLVHDGTTDGLYRCVHDFAPEAAVHLASRFVAEHQSSDIDALIEANLRFGCQLLEALARRAVTRLVNISSAWEHYHTEDYRPVSLYAATKRAFQDLCVFYADAHQMRIVTLKLSDTYGPHDRRPKLISLLGKLAKTGERLNLSPGEQAINFSHVDDVVEAIRVALALTAELQPGETRSYSVQGSEQMTLREFVDLFERVSGRSLSVGWGERPCRKREVMRPWVGKTLPGWSPRIGLEEGLRRVLADI
jgi:nucleoside-diphosphate-sugar epimerase